MSHTFTRRSLYELVWSEPMQHLAKRFSISDRGLAKACVSASIPVPARGYWAKRKAGHAVSPAPLPPRRFGQSDQVTVGRSTWPYEREDDPDLADAPIPPPPVFEPEMNVVRTQVAELVSKASLPLRDTHGLHSQVKNLLTADEERARKQQASRYPPPWDGPIFDTPFEQRRLKILNGLCICLSRLGMKPSVAGKYGRDLSVTVGDTQVVFSLDAAGAAKQIERERHGDAFLARNPKDKMHLAFCRSWFAVEGVRSWQDERGDRLERHLCEIVVEMIVFAEQCYRDGVVRRRKSLIQRQAELQEAERKRRAEEERRRKERQAQRERRRIDHLLEQAHALHQANEIRAYVGAVRDINDTAPNPMTRKELDAWASWALTQAERIDPVVSGAYKTARIC